MNQYSHRGFTLIELAVVIAVIGFLLGGLAFLVKPYIDRNQVSSTETKLQRISDALAEYVIKYNRLPCPAAPNPVSEPFGAPRNSGADGLTTTNACSTAGFTMGDYVGLVPFRALGLGEGQVRDAWGNLITYAVDPLLAGDTPVNEVHAACRRDRTWVVQGVNKNTAKARFCCPARITAGRSALQVTDARVGGRTMWGHDRSVVPGAQYAPPDITATYPLIPDPLSREESPVLAMVLVSHGKNGDGAFISRSAATRDVTASATAEESENRDNDFDFVARPISLTRDDNYFDDIVLWKTNTHLMENFGNNSCARP